ncbi:MAG TPA: Rieske (2Fe-2S) protein [Polyangia bacterium]|jgi:Rieske Fe-S protein
MSKPTRRQVCVAGGAGLALYACGGSGDKADMAPADLAVPSDLTVSLGDIAQPACKSAFNAGPATALAVGQAKFFACEKIYVLRDDAGIYALTAVCTHMGCTVQFKTTDFQCPCHMSAYSLNGAVINPPAMLPLQHFGCSFDGSGNIIVDPTVPVDASTRLTMHD